MSCAIIVHSMASVVFACKHLTTDKNHDDREYVGIDLNPVRKSGLDKS